MPRDSNKRYSPAELDRIFRPVLSKLPSVVCMLHPPVRFLEPARRRNRRPVEANIMAAVGQTGRAGHSVPYHLAASIAALGGLGKAGRASDFDSGAV